MKKIFTLLAIAITAIAFNAKADCFLIGEVNNNAWNPQQGVQISQTETAGVYSGEVEITGNGYFGVADMLLTNDDWDYFNQNCRYNAVSKDLVITLDTEMKMTKGGTDNSWKATPGFYTVTVNFNNNTLKMSNSDGGTVTPTEHTFQMVGSHTSLGWDLNVAPQLIKSEEDNSWSISLTDLSGEFQIVRNKDWNQSCRSNGENIQPNVAYVPAFGNGGEDSNIKLGDGIIYNNVTITVSETGSNAYSIIMTADGQGTIDPVISTYTLVGEINNWTNDATAPTFVSQGDGVYTLSLDELSGQFLILRDMNWEKACRSNGETLIPDVTYVPTFGNGGEESNLTLLPGVIYKGVTITLTETGSNQFSILMTAEETGKVEAPMADYYIVGEINGWINDATAPKFTDNGEGVYSITLPELKGDFLILRDLDWTKAIRSNGSDIELDKLYTPVYGDGGEDSNLSLPAGWIYKNVTITLTYVGTDAYTIMTTAESKEETELPADTFTLVGTTYGWDLGAAPQFSNTEKGVWNIYVDQLEGEFKIVRNNDWTQALNSNGSTFSPNSNYTPFFGQGGEDSNIKLQELTLYKGVNITITETSANNYTIYMTVESSEPITPPADTFSIVGEFNNWDINAAPKFTYNNDDTWSITLDQLYGQFLLVRNDDWNQALRSNGSEIDIDQPYVPTFGEGGEDSNISLPADKTYIGVTMTISKKDTNTYSVVINAEKEIGADEAIYELTGDFNDWELGTAYFTKSSEGVYSLTFEEFNSAGFKVIKNGSFEYQYGANFTLELFSESIEYQLSPLSNEAEIIYTDGETYENVTFTLTIDKDETATILMTGTVGIETIDADHNVEYFNLQGLPVANPEKGGLYIVKRGNKVTKTILK